MNRKWVNVELETNEADAFGSYLKENGFRYERSGCYNLIHFEIFATSNEVDLLNNVLNSICK